jgi:hypothetical protein
MILKVLNGILLLTVLLKRKLSFMTWHPFKTAIYIRRLHPFWTRKMVSCELSPAGSACIILKRRFAIMENDALVAKKEYKIHFFTMLKICN